MKTLKLLIDKGVEEKISQYPEEIKKKIQFLYELIIEVAEEMLEIHELQVVLKWGQVSFISKIGSTLRIDSMPKSQNEYAVFFHCQSKLVDTFKILYHNEFQFKGNRAIVFNLENDVPIANLKECIKAALRYHRVKNLETLGIMTY